MTNILRYSGSKAQLVAEILHHVGTPKLYIEPFLGAAHIALAEPCGPMLLSDANPHVANFWQQVQQDPIGVYSAIHEFKAWPYYSLRKYLNATDHVVNDPALRAGAYCVLMAKCFNGVARVNKDGLINVPLGTNKPNYPTLEQLQHASQRLAGAFIYHQDYVRTFDMVPVTTWPTKRENITVYCDPPYLGQHSAYTKDGFNETDHVLLADRCKTLASTGVRVLVSNSAEAAHLYDWAQRYDLYPLRSVGGRRGTKMECLYVG